jgi:hypothetical protein
MKKEQKQQVSTEPSNVLYTLLCGVFSTLIKTAEEKPTHFKMVRVASSLLIELIPEEWISDYHLDSYCLYFYKDNKELVTKVWWGVGKRGFTENKIYPLCELLNAT